MKSARLPPLDATLRPENAWASFASVAVCLVVLSSLIAGVAAAGGEGDASPRGGRVQSAKVTMSDDGSPRLSVTLDGDTDEVYRLARDAVITLNGAPAAAGDIKPADVVTLEFNETGHATRVDAVRVHAGIVLKVENGAIEITTDYTDKQRFPLDEEGEVFLNGKAARLDDLARGDAARISPDPQGEARKVDVSRISLVLSFWNNFRHNLFKPLLLFFYLGFSVPLLKIALEFPHVMYQALTIYLLMSIGWHGGEELAELSGSVFHQALLFMLIGFLANFLIGIAAYLGLRTLIPKMRRVDAATVGAFYGSDSAGTFVTCLGVLTAAGISYAAYMPVMLAVMEIPGCLVGLFLVSRLRRAGMDPQGNMPGEPGYDPHVNRSDQTVAGEAQAHRGEEGHQAAIANEHGTAPAAHGSGLLSAELLREVFLNPGLFLLFGGIAVGFVSRLQGHKVTEADDSLFLNLFQGLLCLFLLEMGMTASKRLRDLKTAGWRFILFGLLAPNLFATFGICVAHGFSHFTGTPLQLGTYALFAVLCGAASYIAVPAIQRLAIPEASPTLPLAAALGLTFSYNVTIGIPVYIMIAQFVIMGIPLSGR